MTDDAIDAIIAEAFTAPANAQPQADAPKIAETEELPQETTEGGESDKSDAEPPEDPFPKKAVRAISRRDKKIGKLQAELDQARREASELRSRAAPAAIEAGKAPEESEFETYGEYLAAVARHEARKEFTESRSKADAERAESAEAEAKSKEQEIKEERRAAIDENHIAAVAAFPDFEKLFEKNATLIGADGVARIPVSSNLRSALEESDNGAFALYSIWKDGVLDEMNELSLAKAAMMVRDHERKALELSKPNKISSAPEPASYSRGAAASASKPLDRMTPDEIREWLRSG